MGPILATFISFKCIPFSYNFITLNDVDICENFVTILSKKFNAQ